MHFLSEDELARLLSRDELTSEGVRVALRTIRHGERSNELLVYAVTLLPEPDFLTPYLLGALVRADITEAEAAREIKKNKAFCTRLARLLPSIVRFFNDRNNLAGLFRMIDDCQNDFHITAVSPRRDRQTREAKERLATTLRASLEAANAIEEAKRFLEFEFRDFQKVYQPYGERLRFLSELIDELRMCSGVVEIVDAIVDLRPLGSPRLLHMSGNDARTTLVEYAYHMCTMCDGPKLVTTPGSQFSDLCSFLFEAVTGQAEESLSGAINRFARSDERNQWDQEGEEEPNENDNFASQKRKMSMSRSNIRLYTTIARNPRLSQLAKTLLALRLDGEIHQYEEAESAYGPNQVYFEHLNDDQKAAMFADAIKSWRPERRAEFYELMESESSTMEARAVELGKTRRAARKSGIDS